jgi:hydroxyacylglutathione hydrolase
MHKALNETLASLPDDTKVYVCIRSPHQVSCELTPSSPQPGHEYTKGNVRFAKRVLENDAVKKLEEFAANNKETQGKFTIGDEKVCYF